MFLEIEKVVCAGVLRKMGQEALQNILDLKKLQDLLVVTNAEDWGYW